MSQKLTAEQSTEMVWLQKQWPVHPDGLLQLIYCCSGVFRVGRLEGSKAGATPASVSPSTSLLPLVPQPTPSPQPPVLRHSLHHHLSLRTFPYLLRDNLIPISTPLVLPTVQLTQAQVINKALDISGAREHLSTKPASAARSLLERLRTITSRSASMGGRANDVCCKPRLSNEKTRSCTSDAEALGAQRSVSSRRIPRQRLRARRESLTLKRVGRGGCM
jgi:hypothetical protein